MFAITSKSFRSVACIAILGAAASAQAQFGAPPAGPIDVNRVPAQIPEHAKVKSFLVQVTPGVSAAACAQQLLVVGIRPEVVTSTVVRAVTSIPMTNIGRIVTCAGKVSVEKVELGGRSFPVYSIIFGVKEGANYARCKSALRSAGVLVSPLNLEMSGIIQGLSSEPTAQQAARTVSCVSFAENEISASPSPSMRVGN